MAKENYWLELLQNNSLKLDDADPATGVGGAAKLKRGKGRPSTNGAQPAWMLYRAMAIIEGYQKFRREGYNRQVSQEKAVGHVKSLLPKMAVSIGTVKRVLARDHSAAFKECWVVERKPEEVPVWENVPLGAPIVEFKTMEVLQFSLRPFPKHPKTKRTALDFSRKRR